MGISQLSLSQKMLPAFFFGTEEVRNLSGTLWSKMSNYVHLLIYLF